MANLAGMVRPKLQFRTRFRKFGSNPEDSDHKKAMLNGGTLLKSQNRFFHFFTTKISLIPDFFAKKNKKRNWITLKYYYICIKYKHFLVGLIAKYYNNVEVLQHLSEFDEIWTLFIKEK